MRPVHLQAVGMTRFGRRETSYLDLAGEAYQDLQRRLGDAPAPDHLIVASQEPGAFAAVGNAATAVADTLGLSGRAATRIEAAPASGLAAVEAAAALIESGRRDTVLVLGVEKMTGRTTEEANRILAQMADPLERRYGLSMAAEVALMTRAYLDRYGHPVELVHQAASKAHAQGAKNPYAQFQKEVDPDTVAQSPLVADPLRRHHSAPLSDGAACLLLGADPGPVRLAATGHATDALALTHRHGDRALTHFAATRRAAAEAFTRAGLERKEVDVVETHDAFSPMEAINLEDLGLLPEGGALAAIAAGDTRPDGRVPTNCGGGLKARGHPVGATGVAMCVELYWQLTRDEEVRARQAQGPGDGPRVGLAHNMGGLGNNVLVALLEAT